MKLSLHKVLSTHCQNSSLLFHLNLSQVRGYQEQRKTEGYYGKNAEKEKKGGGCYLFISKKLTEINNPEKDNYHLI